MKSFLFLVPTVFVISGCLQTRNDVRSNEQKKVMQQQVVTMQRTNADVTTRFSDVEGTVRDLNGRVEVMENKLGKDATASSDSVRTLQVKNEELGQKVNSLQEALTLMEKQVFALSAEVNSMKAQKTAEVKAAQEAAAQAATKRSTMGPYEQAEEHFNNKDWKQAILSYQKYRDQNPKGAKFPDATYKIGVSFQELGLKDEARTFYEEVTKKFPKSDEARRGKIRLKGL